ncbi:MAG: discoidin domain-containing protein, partial [Planctomycetota bacterium]|nr:discoidin domain-containing protein [Planctomycetota bacterium]
MNRILVIVAVWGCLAATQTRTLSADDAKKVGKPIRALLVTGGCCHDYTRQKQIISKGISARANVVWTIVQQGGTTTNTKIPLYQDPNWADGFDIVIHNECFSDVKDPAWLETILKPHKRGTPAILIHCAMHCYRTGSDEWFKFCGVQSPGHGAHYSYTVDNVKPDHPIMQGFGKQWIAPKGELYHSIKLFDTATPLGQAKRKTDAKPQTCVWTNIYGENKTRVFATTVGHYNETMVEPQYLDMLTRGLLWAVGREDTPIIKTSEDTNNAIRDLATAAISGGGTKTLGSTGGKCCGEGNLALGKPTKAGSEETGKNNFAKNAVDGDLGTRWCAAGGAQSGESWTVDFEQPAAMKSLRIHWEKDGTTYRYSVETSLDNRKWDLLVDATENEKPGRIVAHTFDARQARYVRVNYHGSKGRFWSSFWEFEAYAGDLPELPKSVTQAANNGGPTATVADVLAPPEFNVTMFGSPPTVNYPVCLTAAATGEVFVGVDEQGSLGKEKGRGKVLRCIDTDGDGQADQVNVFAKMDHPRGLIYDNGQLWVLHPPFLTLYTDTDLDGVADKHETLITGISTDEVNRRGADHTTNGIRMGIDGWIYIAVGDFGFTNAVGKDGTKLAKRGGGIVRIRPDGTEMEVFAWGLRNILDVSIDPYMNVFTRDNTNDGGGWDIRTSHILQSGQYGYPSLYKNFADEMLPPMKDYGGGSGCGTMFLHELRWPEPFANAFYSCDWGRSEVYRHNNPAVGPTFAPSQDVFLKIPRPTDIDVDGSGRMYVSSWKNGKFAYSG